MNLYFKFLTLLCRRFFWSKKQSITDTCITYFRVTPFDLDLNFHMNNGRFFSVMDLGRFDLMLKTKSFFSILSKGYYPLVLSETMIFKKSLGLFVKYAVHTKAECWDEKFFYFTQKFFVGRELYTSSSVRICFKQRGRRGIVPTQEIRDILKVKDTDNDLSALALKHIELDSTLIPRNS